MGKVTLKKVSSLGSLSVNSDGRVSVTFDFSKAPVPKETYSASECFLREGVDHDVFLVFVQLDATTGEPQHTLQVKFDDLALANLWKNSQAFHERVGLWYEGTFGRKPERKKCKVPANAPYFQLTSNLAFIGQQENSVVAAFYYFDPRAARDIAQGRVPNKALMWVPVVQVKVSAYAIWNLLNDVRDYVNALIEKYPALQARQVTETVQEGA